MQFTVDTLMRDFRHLKLLFSAFQMAKNRSIDCDAMKSRFTSSKLLLKCNSLLTCLSSLQGGDLFLTFLVVWILTTGWHMLYVKTEL
jgi:hypothetical protein